MCDFSTRVEAEMQRPISGVSVVIPTLNAMPYITQAIESILTQTYKHFEIIIVDGGSTDGTVEYVRGLISNGYPVRVVHQLKGKIGAAHNLGIEAARYEWIACLDADDVSYPERLERQIAFLERYKDIAFVSSDVEYIDILGKPIGIIKKHHLTTPSPYYDPYKDGNTPHQAALYSKEAVLSIGGYRDFPQGEDYDLFLRLSEKYKLGFLPEVLVGSRILDAGLTVKEFELQRIYWKYAKHCAERRRLNLPEIDFELWYKDNQEWIRRKYQEWKGQKLFTLAGVAFTQRKWWQGIRYSMKAILFNPRYVLRKMQTYRIGWRRK